MAQDRVVFLPWTVAQAGSFVSDYQDNNTNRGRSHHKRKWKVVTMDSAGKPLAKVGFGLGCRVHVWGHGAPDDQTIDSDDGSESIDADEVVARMFSKGFPKNYVGTVVADSCHSAIGANPFAKALAKSLWKNGVRASCVLGYKGSLYIQQTQALGGKYTHRGVEVEDKDGNEYEVKSSKAQVRFYGWC